VGNDEGLSIELVINLSIYDLADLFVLNKNIESTDTGLWQTNLFRRLFNPIAFIGEDMHFLNRIKGVAGVLKISKKYILVGLFILITAIKSD
jgi:hypothetical protein